MCLFSYSWSRDGMSAHSFSERVRKVDLKLLQTEIVATTFFLMMVRHPEVVERAQAEIDSVVGSHRLPNLDDREKLPYIDCIVKELLRYVHGRDSPTKVRC